MAGPLFKHPPGVFVAASTKDSDFAQKLSEDLRRVLGDEKTVWYDPLGEEQGGDSWWRHVVRELTSRQVFIVVLSPDAMASPLVNAQIDMAWRQELSRSGKIILPILYRDCQVRADLLTIQVTSFLPPKPYEEAFNEFLIAVSNALKTRRLHLKLSRRTVVTGLLAGVVVAGGFAWWKSTPHPINVYRGHSEIVTVLAWSPDGRHIASGSSDQTVQIWNATDGTHVFTYYGHSNTISTVEWSPDGERIASVADWPDITMRIWDAVNGGHISVYNNGLALSPNGARIVAGVGSNAEIWDVTDGSLVATLNRALLPNGSLVQNVLIWSPDSRFVATSTNNYSSTNDNAVQVWDAASGDHISAYRGHRAGVTAIAWSPDGRYIASNGSINIVGSGPPQTNVQVSDAATGSHIFTYSGHSSIVTAVAWSPDGRRIASGSWDKTVQVWDATDGRHAYTYYGHADLVFAVAWSPDGRYIASGGGNIIAGQSPGDTTVQVWAAG